ncbi:Sentrin-specific protease 1 [Hypsizygus marmoreus]|uniref:Sentrin-specific protease 1 n=1 Tax=Hypsizygus marmoreus TaxID=39966 RepID=A0A369KCY8_HYPMA|nr:Sentrin-specific protease 1 [Hypsizygus marmoreus]
MNPRKRPAAEPLLPLYSAKQRRTRMVGYHGGNPSPSEDAGLLSRWKSFGKEFSVLVTETARTLVYGTRPGMPEDDKAYDEADRSRPKARSTKQLHPAAKVDLSRRSSRGVDHVETIGDHDLLSCPPYPPSTPPRTAASLETCPPPSRPSSAYDTTQHDANLSKRRAQNGVKPRRYRNREHIYAKAHKASVRAETQKSKEEMQRKIYTIQRTRGYTSNFTDFQSLLAFQAKLEKLDQRDAFSPSSSMTDLHAKDITPSSRRHSYSDNDDMEFLRRAFDRAKATLNEPRPPQPFQPSLEQLRLSHRLKDEDIEKLLRPKIVPPTPLPPDDDAQVDVILRKRGHISTCEKQTVCDKDVSRLRPGQWLNDEIINFYGAMILRQSQGCKENPPKHGKSLLNAHCFLSFFWSKLKDQGYEKGRLAKWTKAIDIFSKDVVLIPINHSNAHWTGAAINFRRKRIESYDSMGTRRNIVFKLLRKYLDAEHQNKKKKPFDFTGWEDYSLEEPLQENGYDCGVFTCQFLLGLARGDDAIRFTQKDMPNLRRRMIWEIGKATLRPEP